MTVVDVAPDDGRLLVRPAGLGRRRPVLSFVGVLALIAVVLLVVGRSGVLAPQAELELSGAEGDGMTTHVPIYSLVNHGWRPIEVDLVRAPAGVELAPFTLAGGDHRDLAVPIPCADEIVRPIDLVVRVRSVDTGLVRTLRVDVGEAVACR